MSTTYSIPLQGHISHGYLFIQYGKRAFSILEQSYREITLKEYHSAIWKHSYFLTDDEASIFKPFTEAFDNVEKGLTIFIQIYDEVYQIGKKKKILYTKEAGVVRKTQICLGCIPGLLPGAVGKVITEKEFVLWLL